ncbi:MAG: formimidoylglutamate deiminase [Alphaproteobacteria bacterium]|nr:formimidoylglutamate deiminase [Alphaproteobacteria bacterium]
MASKLHLETALLPDGWHDNVAVGVDDGIIVSVGDAKSEPTAGLVSGVTIPGLPNLHSHAFQRAMAGLTERRGGEADSFWTWREAMYGFVERLTPDDLEAIAALAYMEMLEAGFTSVAEFHYLHHQPDGRPYDNPAEMSERIVAAAQTVGIGLTLLPVLYRQSGFLGKPPSPAQRRFLCDRDLYGRLMETRVPGGTIGITPHSLRAVTLDDLAWAATTWPDTPAHIHISEQTREVDDCLAAHGARPIDLLMDTVEVGPRWHLIHATHADAGEIARMARARAVVGLCPITEANLGDGLFDVPSFLAQGGRFGIGSDSNVRISVADELRTLEYGQRLIHRQRNVLGEAERSTGRRLFDEALLGNAIAIGQRADFVVLDGPGFRGDSVIDHWLFAADNSAIRSVYCGGVHVVANGRHVERDRLRQRYDIVLHRLQSA